MKLAQNLLPVRSLQIHFIDKEKGGHLVPPQQPPQRHRMSLNAVGSADDQHCTVQNGQSPLCLCGKIHMPRCIYQGYITLLCFQAGLFGKNGDSSGPLQTVSIQIGIAMVHPAQGPQGSAAVKQCLGKGGLAGIYMGKKADIQRYFMIHKRSPLLEKTDFITSISQEGTHCR